MTLRCAAIQFAPVFGKKRENQRKLVRLIEEAAAGGAKIVVAPELALNGYSYMSEEEALVDAEIITLGPALRAIDEIPTTKLMYQLAARLNIHIAWGMVELDEGTSKLYNSQVLMSPDGSYVSYRKINHFGNDYLWATHGQGNPPVTTIETDGKDWRVGLLICRDVRDKKDQHWDSFYEPGDADLVLLSANWGRGAFPATAWMDFVENNKTSLVVANRYGQEVNNDFGAGGVCVIERNGKVHCKGLQWNADCIVYGEV